MKIVIAHVERSRGRYNIFVNDRLHKGYVKIDYVLKFLHRRYRRQAGRRKK